ncbi:MAG TPA: arginase family protein [Candidatus Nanopelagicales bacterium]|jgi:arginase
MTADNGTGTGARWTVLGVPIDSVAAPAGGPVFGTEAAPAVLRAMGLVRRLGADDVGDLDVRIVDPDRDPVSGLVGWPSLRPVTIALRQAVADLVEAGARPLLLGGCCALLPGAVAGARDVIGRLGLAYADGHIDVYDNRTSPTGEAADMPVAALLGHGWPGWLDLLGALPVVAGTDVLVLGARDEQEAEDIGSLPQHLGITVLGPSELPSGDQALELLAPQQFWLHLDLDVLDEDAFPATDSLMPGGLELAELADLLRPLGRSERVIGASIGCYNPSKDDTGTYGRALTDLLVDVLVP